MKIFVFDILVLSTRSYNLCEDSLVSRVSSGSPGGRRRGEESGQWRSDIGAVRSADSPHPSPPVIYDWCCRNGNTMGYLFTIETDNLPLDQFIGKRWCGQLGPYMAKSAWPCPDPTSATAEVTVPAPDVRLCRTSDPTRDHVARLAIRHSPLRDYTSHLTICNRREFYLRRFCSQREPFLETISARYDIL